MNSNQNAATRISGQTLAFLVLRLWLAVRAIGTCIEKFAETKMVQKALSEDSDIIVQVQEKVYSLGTYHGIPASLHASFLKEPLMPSWALAPYGYVLGALLALTGITLLLGILTRASLFIMGIIYVTLTFGMILLGQDNGIAWLGTHTIIIALALYLSDHNRFAITKA